MTNTTFYRGATVDAASPSRSANVWSRCPYSPENQSRNPDTEGYFYFEDFLNAPSLTSAATSNGLAAFFDTTGYAKQIPTEKGGVYQLSTYNVANNSAGVTTCGNTGAMTVVTSGASGKRMWFEARIRATQITDTGLYIGLSEEALAADNSLVDGTCALASKDFIGFLGIANAATLVFDAVYRKAGQTAGNPTNLAGAAATSVLTGVAATWYKFGLLYDRGDNASHILKWYLNGAEVAYMTDVSGATFPDGEELCPLYFIKTIAGTTKTADIDWWAVAGEL